MLKCLAIIAAGLSASVGPAAAQSATVYCVNGKIMVERASMSQMQSGRGHAPICIIGPSFDFQPDGRRWVQSTLNSDIGGNCSCR